MKALIVSLFLMMSLGAFGQYDYEIKSVWKDTKAEAGKTYFALASKKKSRWSTQEIVLVFGRKNGKLKVRAFSLGGWNMQLRNGAKTTSKDDFYKLSTLIDNGKIKATMEPRGKWGKTHKMTYSLRETASSKRFASFALKTVLAQKEALRNAKSFKNISEFKARLDLILWDYDYDTELDEDFIFATFPLQIEWDFSYNAPNKAIAKAKIKKNGSDIISKTFLDEGQKWVGEDQDVLFMAEEEVERIYYDDLDIEPGHFNTFSKTTSGFEDEVLNKAASKFVKYEIRSATGWECEDGIYTWESITWVLVDGSSYSYWPGTECD